MPDFYCVYVFRGNHSSQRKERRCLLPAPRPRALRRDAECCGTFPQDFCWQDTSCHRSDSSLFLSDAATMFRVAVDVFPVSSAEMNPSPTWTTSSALAGEFRPALMAPFTPPPVQQAVTAPPARLLLSPLLPVVRLWLEEYSEDFQEPPQYPTLRLLCAHLRRRLCFRRLAQTAEALLKRLQEQGTLKETTKIKLQALSLKAKVTRLRRPS